MTSVAQVERTNLLLGFFQLLLSLFALLLGLMLSLLLVMLVTAYVTSA